MYGQHGVGQSGDPKSMHDQLLYMIQHSLEMQYLSLKSTFRPAFCFYYFHFSLYDLSIISWKYYWPLKYKASLWIFCDKVICFGTKCGIIPSCLKSTLGVVIPGKPPPTNKVSKVASSVHGLTDLITEQLFLTWSSGKSFPSFGQECVWLMICWQQRKGRLAFLLWFQSLLCKAAFECDDVHTKLLQLLKLWCIFFKAETSLLCSSVKEAGWLLIKKRTHF